MTAFWGFPRKDTVQNGGSPSPLPSPPPSLSLSFSRFAHITEVLGALKPDVMLGNLGPNLQSSHGPDAELDTLRRTKNFEVRDISDLNKLGSQHLVRVPNSNTNSNANTVIMSNLQELHRGVLHDSLPAQVDNEVSLPGQVDLDSYIHCLKLDEQSNLLPAADPAMNIEAIRMTVIPHSTVPPLVKQKKQNTWEYALSSEPLPNMFSTKPSLQQQRQLRSSFDINLTVGNQQPVSCKLKLKKLPLKTFQMQNSKISKLPKEEKVEQKKKTRAVVKRYRLKNIQVLKQLFCGGFAGVISRTAVAPLDLIKTYLITSHGLPGSHKSAMEIFKDITSSSGWQGLFRGNLVNCIRVAPNKAIELCVFEMVRRELNKEGHPLKHLAATIAGGAAGMAGTAATYPLELVRTRLSVQPELYSGLLQAVTRITKEEGLIAFYAGLTPSLVGVFPYAAANYFVYDGLRSTYCRSTGQHNVPVVPTLAFGAIAAAASSTVTYPLEVARRQMQLCVTNGAKKTTMGIILDIYKHEGFLALYRGLGTTWLKLIPAAGISFVCYEAARKAFHIDEASVVAKAAAEEEELSLSR